MGEEGAVSDTWSAVVSASCFGLSVALELAGLPVLALAAATGGFINTLFWVTA